jgi:hypothetical protein
VQNQKIQVLDLDLIHFPSATNALQRGMPNETLLAILAGSDEYFARV